MCIYIYCNNIIYIYIYFIYFCMILVFQASPTWSVHFKWSWFGVGSAADFWPFWHTTAMWIWPWHWWQCWFSGFYGLGHAGTLLYYTLLGWFFGTEYLDVFCVLQVKHSTPSLFFTSWAAKFLGMWTIQSHTLGKCQGNKSFRVHGSFHGRMTTRPCYSWRA